MTAARPAGHRPDPRVDATRGARWRPTVEASFDGTHVRGLVSTIDPRVWCVIAGGVTGTTRRLYGVFGLPGHVRSLADAVTLSDFDGAVVPRPAEARATLLAIVPIAVAPPAGPATRNVLAAGPPPTRH